MKIKLVSERVGEHVRERVFVGEHEGALALAGTLMFRVGEWQAFGAALRLGAGQMKGQLEVELVGDEEVVR